VTDEPLRAVRRQCARAAIVVIASAASSVPLAAEGDGPSLKRLTTFVLPEEVAAAVDVRWQEDGALLLGVGGNGIYSWQIGDERAELWITLAGSRIGGFGRIQDYSRLGGASSGVTAFSSSSYGTFRHEEGEISAPKEIEIVGDLDRRYARTAVVGLSRGPDGGWENRLAWLVSSDGSVRGILPRRSEDSHWFLAAELGVVRVLSDWLSRHRVIDEVVADSRGNVFFFVRHVPSEIPYPTHLPAGQQRVTGGLIDIGPSGEARPQPLTDEQAVKLMELLESTGNNPESGEPITISGSALNRILAETDPPPATQRAKVCWDLVHAHIDDLRNATKSDCVVDSDFADARLRADLRGDRVAVLIRGDTYGFVPEVRRSEAFEARIGPPNH